MLPQTNANELFAEGNARGWSGTTHLALPGYAGKKPENISPGNLAVCRKGRVSVSP
jgi:hypothetical protein